MILYRELIKQCALRLLPGSQHRNLPHLVEEIESAREALINKSFSTK
jgi:hypothetical protein